MRFCRAAAFLPLICSVCARAAPPSAAALADSLREMSLDPTQGYRVRDLELIRGDIKIYLSEGTLFFGEPIAGRLTAAVFDTAESEGGDGEILVLPPRPSERSSLASFTQSPNLDEHFNSAVFFFGDATGQELLSQINDRPLRKLTEDDVTEQSKKWNRVLRNLNSGLTIRMIESLLDEHKPGDGYFYAVLGGNRLGPFDVSYAPAGFEPVSIGRAAKAASGSGRFELWTSFRPRHAPAYTRPVPSLSGFVMDVSVLPDLSISASAKFRMKALAAGRAVTLELASQLEAKSANVDGQPAEVFQRDGFFLLVCEEPFVAGKDYAVEVQYSGKVISRTADGSYFVDERNAWFPHTGPMLADFDMTFHCPEKLRLVSTGKLVSDTVSNGTRTVHRRTAAPERFAGFNLGEYGSPLELKGKYTVECYANRSFPASLERDPVHNDYFLSLSNPGVETVRGLLGEAQQLLTDYSAKWGDLPVHDLIVSPVPGYFGQGFPGLIYLSNISYLREQDRPADLRDPMGNLFFSQLLLPHETAHQWWGNLITSADYRTDWLMEAMANEAALEELNQNKGAGSVEQVLGAFRAHLLQVQPAQKQEAPSLEAKTLESAGPVDFGIRLREAYGFRTWQVIVYEKGAWILHMLRQRLGEEGFALMQARILKEFSSKPITNEDFRAIASSFSPAGAPDRTLQTFFDAWVYGTGIPKIGVGRNGRVETIEVAEVDEDFEADLPLHCKLKKGGEELRFAHVTFGSNDWELPPDVASCRLPGPSEFLYRE